MKTSATPGQESACCAEFAALSRRGFLTGSAALVGASTLFGSTLLTVSSAAAATSRGTLVVLSLRGGFDGLSAVVPHGDPEYYKARPGIGVPKSQLLGADAMFGLHPALAPLLPLWRGGSLAAVQAVGKWRRSHFLRVFRRSVRKRRRANVRESSRA